MTTCSLVRLNSKSRRLTLGLLAALFAMPALVGAVKAASLDEIKKRGLIVATEDDFRPFEFVKDGKPTGFDNELIEFAEIRTIRDQAGNPALDRHPGRRQHG